MTTSLWSPRNGVTNSVYLEWCGCWFAEVAMGTSTGKLNYGALTGRSGGVGVVGVGRMYGRKMDGKG